MMSDIVVNFIEASHNRKYKIRTDEFKMKNILGLPFIVGKVILENSKFAFVVKKVESTTHVYEVIDNKSQLKVTEKATNEIHECENTVKFRASPKCRFDFPKVFLLTRKLFGHEEIIDDIRNCLTDGDQSRLICLYGPPGCGKRMIMTKLEDEMVDKTFSVISMNYRMNNLLPIFDWMRQIKKNIILYFPRFDILVQIHPELKEFYKQLKSILADRTLNIKVVVDCFDSSIVDSTELRDHAFKIMVPNINKKAKMDMVKHLIFNKTGRTEFEDGFEKFINSISAFTPQAIYNFVNRVAIEGFTELRLEHLIKCRRDKSITHHACDIDELHWSDIGGYADVKRQLQDQIEKPIRLGRQFPKGLLLYGPPGCSKTMFARAIATECQMTLFVVRPSSIMKSLVGESERLLNEICIRATASAPSIIFIDELDTLFPSREISTGSEVSQRLLNVLLCFQDGIKTRKNHQVILMGSTNLVEKIDKALIRPGRMDLHIKIDLPDQDSRISILELSLSNKNFKMDEDVQRNIPNIARGLQNLSGAAIVDVGKQIKRLVERKQEEQLVITMDHVRVVCPFVNINL